MVSVFTEVNLVCIGFHLRFGTDDLRAKLIDLLPSLRTVVGLTPCLERTSTQMAAVAASRSIRKPNQQT